MFLSLQVFVNEAPASTVVPSANVTSVTKSAESQSDVAVTAGVAEASVAVTEGNVGKGAIVEVGVEGGGATAVSCASTVRAAAVCATFVASSRDGRLQPASRLAANVSARGDQATDRKGLFRTIAPAILIHASGQLLAQVHPQWLRPSWREIVLLLLVG
jgi:hypothetical protein